ncbi:hypothetical protein OG205_20390 [Lentzea sp. NBC_00516]|uniref:hypothetical protein n=1 Tax=Lentzea sp. NBC_00516 TaxID=2903582 RepID=UPI002E811E21|nr:hypothetical protein [Lentzea sp. NBC_00516]WUD29279.1 hypothetical protein OG205_20390 [Lentzea sp. NBC_00516]
MLLTEDQRNLFATLIVDHLNGQFYGTAAMDLFGAQVLRTVPSRSGPFRDAHSFIVHMESELTSALFVKVLREVDKSGLLAELQALADRLERGELRWGAQPGAEILWMPLDQPFADRSALRTVVQSMAIGVGPPAIAIEAPAGHGKRTMCAYVEDLARQHSVVPVVNHLRRTGDACVVEYLVTRLRMSIPLSAPVFTLDPRRQARLLARDADGGRPTWFVVNLQGSEQDEGVLAFVDELLNEVQQDPLYSGGLRMIVLADDLLASGLNNLPDAAHRHTLPEITCAELEQWFALALPGRSATDYAKAAAMVLEQVDAWKPSPHMRLSYVAQHCAAVHRHLTGVLNGHR